VTGKLTATDITGLGMTLGIHYTDFEALDLHLSAGADKFFVFGHKPAFTYNYSAASGGKVSAAGLDANPNIALRDAFWSVITKYNATYFCGHEHIPNVQKFSDPTAASKAAAYQVIVGSGGSPFDDKLSGNQIFYQKKQLLLIALHYLLQ